MSARRLSLWTWPPGGRGPNLQPRALRALTSALCALTSARPSFWLAIIVGRTLTEEREWKFHDVTGSERKIVLPPHSLGFSFCQVPVIYKLDDDRAQLSLTVEDWSTIQIEGMALDVATSKAIFRRLGTVTHIEVTVPRSLVRQS